MNAVVKILSICLLILIFGKTSRAHLDSITIYINSGDLVKASRLCHSVLSGEDPVGRINAYRNLGTINSIQGFNKKANEYYRKSISEACTLRADSLEVLALNNLGIHFLQMGRLDSAQRVFFRCREKAEVLKDTVQLIKSHINLTALATEKGDFDQADSLIRKATRWAESKQNVRLQFICNHSIGDLRNQQTRYQDAKIWLHKAEKLGTKLSDSLLLADLYHNLYVAYHNSGDYSIATEYKKNRDRIENSRFSANEKAVILSQDWEANILQGLRQNNRFWLIVITFFLLIIIGLVATVFVVKKRKRDQDSLRQILTNSNKRDQKNSRLIYDEIMNELLSLRFRYPEDSDFQEVLQNATDSLAMIADVISPASMRDSGLRLTVEWLAKAHERVNGTRINIEYKNLEETYAGKNDLSIYYLINYLLSYVKKGELYLTLERDDQSTIITADVGKPLTPLKILLETSIPDGGRLTLNKTKLNAVIP
ncbi:hypothetical protein KFE98_01615 [bacterium SCSIO 12741]|nr:hypothetical protein KFE98_01615 [bacterium SCSIO 12741]